MKVFRIENSNGTGPYRHSEIGSELCRINSGTTNHPGPSSDKDSEGKPLCNFLWQDRSYIFGFASLEQLLAWFLDELELLRSHGFVVSVYESSQVVEGRFQVIFIRESDPIETIKL